MKSQKPLSDLYDHYMTGSLSRKDFEGRIFQHLMDNFVRYRFFDKDKNRWEEFISWLYPRIARAIELYRDLGSSFDAYITSLVHSASKEYRIREADHRITEYVCWQARTEEMCVHEAEVEYMETQNDISIPDGVKPRQLLVLLLKSYYFVSDKLVEKAAQAIGMQTESVMRMIGELKKRRGEKEAEISALRERLYCQHYRCLTFQTRMDTAQPGTDRHNKMRDRYERAKKRFASMKKRLGKMRLDASNRLIADVMGIPKGTVDSNLFAVKNHLASYME